MKTQIEQRFSDFHEKWMSELEHLLQSPQQVSEESAAIDKLTAHHKAYYSFKWAVAQDDVLAFYAPVWLNPFERAHMWVTGWKPSAALRLADPLHLTEEQRGRMATLRAQIKAEEERVEGEMERLHVAVADRKMLELMRLGLHGEGSSGAVAKVDAMVDAALKVLTGRLLKVMKMADCARLRTLKGVLDVVGPMHGVCYLASVAMFLIRVRKLGETG